MKYWLRGYTHYDHKTFQFLKRGIDVIPRHCINRPGDEYRGYPIFEMNELTPFLWPAAAETGVKFGIFRRRLEKLVQAKINLRYKEEELERVRQKTAHMLYNAELERDEAIAYITDRENMLCG